MQTNLDPLELAKFNTGNWWDMEGAYRLLHQLNPVRVSFIQQNTTLKDKKIIDLGCGGGILTEALAREGADCVGIDLNEAVLEQARLHAKTQNLSIHYVCAGIEPFAEQHPGAFDLVTCMELLEHVPDAASLIAAAALLVKPGSFVFFSTLNRTWRAYIESIVLAEYLLNWLPQGTHDYQKFIKPSELMHAAEPHDLKLKALKGLGYHLAPFRFYLKEDPSNNYLMAFQKSASPQQQ